MLDKDQIHINLTPETIHVLGFPINNSFFTMIIVMILLVILMISALGRPKLVPGRWQGLWELICETLLNLVEGNLGRTKLARRLFPLVATLFIFILFANWFSLLPGVGSIGYEEVEVVATKNVPLANGSYGLVEQGVIIHSAANDNSSKVTTFGAGEHAVRVLGIQGQWAQVNAVPVQSYREFAFDEAAGQLKPLPNTTGFIPVKEIAPSEIRRLIQPIIRPPNADLNMTLAMALIAVITANVIAILSHGLLGWIKEFFPKPYVMDPLLTPIEIVGQFARVTSLTFRLFGNVFAGEALLAVILYIAPPALVIFLALELFFGFIQALVFASLTLAYISLAVAGMGEHSHDDKAHDHAAVDPAHADTRESVGTM